LLDSGARTNPEMRDLGRRNLGPAPISTIRRERGKGEKGAEMILLRRILVYEKL
jgi:hypothetical protein